jgi:hypothetical protein
MRNTGVFLGWVENFRGPLGLAWGGVVIENMTMLKKSLPFLFCPGLEDFVALAASRILHLGYRRTLHMLHAMFNS